MKGKKLFAVAAGSSAILLAMSASGGFVVTQSSSPAPTYSQILTFDEPGTPTGSVASAHYQPMGLTVTTGADPTGFAISDVSGSLP